MQWWHIMLIVLAVVAAVMAGLYFYGKKLQKRQNEAQAQIDAMKQVASILVIDKKMLKMKENTRLFAASSPLKIPYLLRPLHALSEYSATKSSSSLPAKKATSLSNTKSSIRM